jgi:hypothetical protein
MGQWGPGDPDAVARVAREVSDGRAGHARHRMHGLRYTHMQTRSVMKLAWAPLAVACVLFALWVAMVGGLIAIALLACIPTVARSPAEWTAELAQLVFYRGTLLRQADELRRSGVSPAVAAVAIDGFGSMTSGIALDPTGEILLTPE